MSDTATNECSFGYEPTRTPSVFTRSCSAARYGAIVLSGCLRRMHSALTLCRNERDQLSEDKVAVGPFCRQWEIVLHQRVHHPAVQGWYAWENAYLVLKPHDRLQRTYEQARNRKV